VVGLEDADELVDGGGEVVAAEGVEADLGGVVARAGFPFSPSLVGWTRSGR
jgi:hypothetical protein